MRINDQDWSIINVIRAFFPFQLIVSHIKHNIFPVIFWTMLFLFINDLLGYSFGIPLLFLSPEYLGEVSTLSFLLIGFAFGGFVMGFNTYSYIQLGPYYPFLTTLNRPFFKFCINNSLIPLIFVINYIYRLIEFQMNEEFATGIEVSMYTFAFLSGIAVFMTFSFLFFFRISKYNKSYQVHSSEPIGSVMHKHTKWYDIFKRQQDRTSIYIGSRFRLIPSRSSKHFDKELVETVFAKNRINASIYEILTILIFFGLGIFNDYDPFEVPAAASIVLLITIFQMILSALQSWLRSWFYPVFVITFLVMNYLSQHSDMFHYTSYAYGLDYSKSSDCSYTVERIRSISDDHKRNQESFVSYTRTLNNWKTSTGEEKPKLILINTSGGGSRSSLWTVTVLQQLDKVTKGKLSDHTQLITGASGGMIGAAYYRELLLRMKLGEISDITSELYRDNISKDVLNKLSFMASTNDIFIRYQKVSFDGIKYTKDRGFAFEKQLLKNTDNILDHNLGYYSRYEKSGIIPTIIFTPTIINDGRRLFICSQTTNFLTSGEFNSNKHVKTYENIDIHSLLSNQNTMNLRFPTALRSSATFPFVMPMITLPTTPEVQLMDAGIRDNYGGKTMMQFLHVMEDWINKNTSGVIVIQIRDRKKMINNETFKQVSFLDKLTLPFGNMYKNFPRVQDYNQDELIELGTKSLDFPVDIISFNLLEKTDDRISLSWHLTSQEKNKIYNAFRSYDNQTSLKRLLFLLQ